MSKISEKLFLSFLEWANDKDSDEKYLKYQNEVKIFLKNKFEDRMECCKITQQLSGIKCRQEFDDVKWETEEAKERAKLVSSPRLVQKKRANEEQKEEQERRPVEQNKEEDTQRIPMS